MKWVERLFKDHKFMRRFTLLYILSLVGYATYSITDWTDSKYATLCGLITIAIGLYQWDKKLQYENKNG